MSFNLPDNRKSPDELYRNFSKLTRNGWIRDEIMISSDGVRSFPINSYRTRNSGKTLYLASGIHGEESSGPNALAKSVDSLIELGEKIPIVLLPLLNPVGYSKNWRYVSQQFSGGEGRSVNDAEHVLPRGLKGKCPEYDKPTCLDAFHVFNYLLRSFDDYRPEVLLDFHEDEFASGSYAYCHGTGRVIARSILDVIESRGIPIIENGKTRFGEKIKNRLVVVEDPKQRDFSLEDFFVAGRAFYHGKIQRIPNTQRSFALELPQKDIEFEKRVDVYSEVISRFPEILGVSKKTNTKRRLAIAC